MHSYYIDYYIFLKNSNFANSNSNFTKISTG